MKLLIFVSVLVIVAYAECADDVKYVIYDLKKAAELFAKFRHDYGKSYSSEAETQRRFAIFKDNLRHINKINSQHLSWYAGINQFADMTREEIQQCCLGFNPSKKKNNNKKLSFKSRPRMVILDSAVDDSSGST